MVTHVSGSVTSRERYLRFDEFGGAEKLYLDSRDASPLRADQLRVRVHAAAINPLDLRILANGPQAKIYGVTLPSGSGNDFAGVIAEVGEEVSEFAVGELVFGEARLRAHADVVVVGEQDIVRVPSGLSLEQAGGLNTSGKAAIASVASVALTELSTVVISGATGSVGLLAVQLARAAGAKVIGIARASQHDLLRDYGVTPIDSEGQLVTQLRSAAPEGITAVLDYQGAETIDAALELGIPAQRINTIAAKKHRTNEGVQTVHGGAERPAVVAALAEQIARGVIHFPVDSTFPLEDFSQAYARLDSRRARGKIVLAPTR